jgi:hypothetical protein
LDVTIVTRCDCIELAAVIGNEVTADSVATIEPETSIVWSTVGTTATLDVAGMLNVTGMAGAIAFNRTKQEMTNKK